MSYKLRKKYLTLLKDTFDLDVNWFIAFSDRFTLGAANLLFLQLDALKDILGEFKATMNEEGNVYILAHLPDKVIECCLFMEKYLVGQVQLWIRDTVTGEIEFLGGHVLHFSEFTNRLKRLKKISTLNTYGSPGDGEYRIQEEVNND